MKRIIVNLIIVIAFAALGAYCYDLGKAYDVVFANTPVTVDGKEYLPLEAVQVYLNKNSDNPVFLVEDDQMVAVAVGRRHKLTIQNLDENDNVIETREVAFNIRDLDAKRHINVTQAWNTGTLGIKKKK